MPKWTFSRTFWFDFLDKLELKPQGPQVVQSMATFNITAVSNIHVLTHQHSEVRPDTCSLLTKHGFYTKALNLNLEGKQASVIQITQTN